VGWILDMLPKSAAIGRLGDGVRLARKMWATARPSGKGCIGILL